MLKIVHKIYARFGNSKTLLFLLGAALVSVCLLLFVYFHQYSRQYEDNTVKAMQTMLEQASFNVANYVKSVELVSDNIANNNEFIKKLKDNPEDAVYANQLDEMKYMEKFVMAMEKSGGDFRIRLFISDKKIYSREQITFFEMRQAEAFPWYRQVVESGSKIVWQLNDPVEYLDEGTQHVTTCVRMLKDYDELSKQVAILAIDMDNQLIREALGAFDQETVYITDGAGRIAFHSDAAREGALDDVSYESPVVYEKNEIVVNSQIPGTDWHIVARIDRKNIGTGKGLLTDSLTISIVIVVIVLGVMILGFIKFVNDVAGRIDLLTSTMGAENGGHAEASNPLYSKIDEMIFKSQTMIREMYDAQARERGAQLKALQAQINPHFLYNTLDAINWMTMNGEKEEASSMIGSLAKYFRLSLNNGRDIVQLLDEIELAKVYISIQRMRFKNSFDVEFETDPDCNHCQIPKLTLQPVIENALIHGLQKCSREIAEKRRPKIVVAVTRDGGHLVLSVTDNGTGMPQEKIKQILSGEGSSGSYGLYNVGERIRLFSDHMEECGVDIYSVEGEYTTVVLTIRAVEK